MYFSSAVSIWEEVTPCFSEVTSPALVSFLWVIASLMIVNILSYLKCAQHGGLITGQHALYANINVSI